jgi:hypothetical protein
VDLAARILNSTARLKTPTREPASTQCLPRGACSAIGHSLLFT